MLRIFSSQDTIHSTHCYDQEVRQSHRRLQRARATMFENLHSVPSGFQFRDHLVDQVARQSRHHRHRLVLRSDSDPERERVIDEAQLRPTEERRFLRAPKP